MKKIPPKIFVIHHSGRFPWVHVPEYDHSGTTYRYYKGKVGEYFFQWYRIDPKTGELYIKQNESYWPKSDCFFTTSASEAKIHIKALFDNRVDMLIEATRKAETVISEETKGINE